MFSLFFLLAANSQGTEKLSITSGPTTDNHQQISASASSSVTNLVPTLQTINNNNSTGGGGGGVAFDFATGGEVGSHQNNNTNPNCDRNSLNSDLDLESLNLMLEPHLRPATPTNSRLSQNIFNEHKSLAQEYLKVRFKVSNIDFSWGI